MKFNLWRQLRNAACVVLLLSSLLHNWGLMFLGYFLLVTSIVGGVDRLERQVENLEKEKANAKIEA